MFATPPPSSIIVNAIPSTVEDAKTLLSERRFSEAEELLESQLASGARDTETYFLLGLIEVEKQQYRKAIGWFRLALAREPSSARLRLELGRAFYLARDYANAEIQFQRALAGHLPRPVQSNVRRYLERIRRERKWSYTFDIRLAPDTNINAGSSASETTIFGLPFELGSDVKMRSGMGIVGGASLEFSPRLNDRVSWKTGVAAERSDYKGTRFDDTIINAWSGPRWFGKNVEISAEATALWRWYGLHVYQRALGGQLETIVYAGRRTALTTRVALQEFDYPTFKGQSGPVWSLGGAVVRTLDPTTSIALLVGGALQNARTRDLSNRSGSVSLSATHDFRAGFVVTAVSTYTFTDYDAADAFFGIERRDRSRQLRITILNRRASIGRFTPTITYTHLRRKSSINLYDSSQDRLEAGLTTTF